MESCLQIARSKKQDVKGKVVIYLTISSREGGKTSGMKSKKKTIALAKEPLTLTPFFKKYISFPSKCWKWNPCRADASWVIVLLSVHTWCGWAYFLQHVSIKLHLHFPLYHFLLLCLDSLSTLYPWDALYSSIPQRKNGLKCSLAPNGKQIACPVNKLVVGGGGERGMRLFRKRSKVKLRSTHNTDASRARKHTS